MWPASPVGACGVAVSCTPMPLGCFDPDGGAAVLRSAGQSDAFVAKFSSDGTLRRR
jgi:hypothetical protein